MRGATSGRVHSTPPPPVVCLHLNDTSLMYVRAEHTNCVTALSAGILGSSGSAVEGAMARGKRNDVQRLREEQLMSKAELARRAGVSVLTIDRVERGSECRVDTKRKIILALGYSVEDRRNISFDGQAPGSRCWPASSHSVSTSARPR